MQLMLDLRAENPVEVLLGNVFHSRRAFIEGL
jgi:hypothetical protein